MRIKLYIDIKKVNGLNIDDFKKDKNTMLSVEKFIKKLCSQLEDYFKKSNIDAKISYEKEKK